jgi:hypothetical protein
LANVRDAVDSSLPSSTSVKDPSGPEPVNSNSRVLSGVASFSISIVPGLMRLRKVQVANWFAPSVTEALGIVVRFRRTTPLAPLVLQLASTNW